MVRRLLCPVLSIALATVHFAAPAAATNVDGYSLSACSSPEWGGGIQVYNDDGQSGGSRVWCVPHSGGSEDNNLGAFPGDLEDWDMTNIGSFLDKTNSIKLRANPFCWTQVWFYDDTGTPVGDHFAKREIDNQDGTTVVVQSQDLADNILGSASISAWCVGG